MKPGATEAGAGEDMFQTDSLLHACPRLQGILEDGATDLWEWKFTVTYPSTERLSLSSRPARATEGDVSKPAGRLWSEGRALAEHAEPRAPQVPRPVLHSQVWRVNWHRGFSQGPSGGRTKSVTHPHSVFTAETNSEAVSPSAPDTSLASTARLGWGSLLSHPSALLASQAGTGVAVVTKQS